MYKLNFGDSTEEEIENIKLNKKLKVATVFSGIGAIEHALKRMAIEHEIVFACDNGDVDILSKKIKAKTIEELKKEIKLLEKEKINKEIFEEYITLKTEIEQLTEENLNDKKSKKILKEYNDKLSMFYEKMKTLYIQNQIKNLSYEEKKNYIDGLYKKEVARNKVRQSYFANYNIKEEDFHWNVSFLDGKQYRNKVDLFVGGSPCQSFSLVGKQRGLQDTRGTLFYEFARLVGEIRPKVFIYENVRAVLGNDEGRTWEIMKQVFSDLGYDWNYKILNSKDYGIPQNRERVFVVGFRKDLQLKKKFMFPNPIKLEKTMQDFLIENVSGKYYLREKGVNFVLSEKNLTKRFTQVDGDIQLCQKKNQHFKFVEDNKVKEETMQDLEKYFLSEKIVKYVMATGTKGFCSKPKTDLEIARPLLKTMHKMHRAGVDNYVTTEGRLRKLTPRECLRLMGFCDSFKIVVSDTSMYQQAGNSIVVDVLIAIMKKIINSYDFE